MLSKTRAKLRVKVKRKSAIDGTFRKSDLRGFAVKIMSTVLSSDISTIQRQPKPDGSSFKLGNAGRFLIAVLLITGLASSFLAVSRVIRPDSDTATPAVVAAEVARHGLMALKVWHYTQDSWLLSVILPDLIIYQFFGSAPWTAVIQGWLLLVTCCSLVAWIARRLIPWPAALCLGTLLLFAHPDSLGPYGLLANPVSHGVTMAWSLLGLLFCLKWIDCGGLSGLGAACCVVIASTSDPWAKAALLLPLLLACLICMVFEPREHQVQRRRVAVAGFALLCLLADNRWFGLLGFLPSSRYQTGHYTHLLSNSVAVSPVIASFFSVLPGHSPITTVATLMLLGPLLAVSARMLYNKPTLLPVFCVLSCVGTMAAFILSDLDVGLPLGRMLLNTYYLIPILLAATLRDAARLWRFLGWGGAGLLATSAMYETIQLPPAPDFTPSSRLYKFLEQHELSYGYGPYWPVQANASSWITHNRVVIRPLEAKGSMPLQARTGGQVFPWWYEPSDSTSKDGRVFFVAIPDSETCASKALCVSAAIRSFGLPDQRLDWDGIPILVWNHPILDHLPDAETRAAAPVLRLGESMGISAPILWRGWSMPGPDGASSIAEQSSIILNQGSRPSPGPQKLCAMLRATGRRGRASQRIRVLLDGRSVGIWDVAAGIENRYCVRIEQPKSSSILTLEHPRGPGWHYQREIPGIHLTGLSLSSDM